MGREAGEVERLESESYVGSEEGAKRFEVEEDETI